MTHDDMSCDILPRLGELTCNRIFSMSHQMPFELCLGGSLGLSPEFKTVEKSIAKNADTLQHCTFKSLLRKTSTYLNCSHHCALPCKKKKKKQSVIIDAVRCCSKHPWRNSKTNLKLEWITITLCTSSRKTYLQKIIQSRYTVSCYWMNWLIWLIYTEN